MRPVIFYVINRVSEYRPEIFHVLRVISLGKPLSCLVQTMGVQSSRTASDKQFGTRRFAITNLQDQPLCTILQLLADELQVCTPCDVHTERCRGSINGAGLRHVLV